MLPFGSINMNVQDETVHVYKGGYIRFILTLVMDHSNSAFVVTMNVKQSQMLALFTSTHKLDALVH